jgi:hypothetical protein
MLAAKFLTESLERSFRARFADMEKADSAGTLVAGVHENFLDNLVR